MAAVLGLDASGLGRMRRQLASSSLPTRRPVEAAVQIQCI